jgi:hypothetical protein
MEYRLRFADEVSDQAIGVEGNAEQHDELRIFFYEELVAVAAAAAVTVTVKKQTSCCGQDIHASITVQVKDTDS